MDTDTSIATLSIFLTIEIVVLRNIGPPGCDPGCVVASSSTVNPEYWFQWTRDSAMVFKVVIEYWKRDLHPGGKDASQQLIMAYLNEMKKVQRQHTLSGDFKTGGLGEAKFWPNGDTFTGE